MKRHISRMAITTIFSSCLIMGCANGEQVLDLSEKLMQNETRAGRIRDRSELIGGPAEEGNIGDFKIYNENVRFIIHNPLPSDGYILNGGAIVDADMVRDDGQPGQDMIKEHTPVFGFIRTHKVDKVKVVSAGGIDEPAVIESSGSDGGIGIGAMLSSVAGSLGELMESLDVFSEKNLRIKTRYVLEPGVNYLKIETTIKNEGDEIWPGEINVEEFINQLGSYLSHERKAYIRRALVKGVLDNTVGDVIVFTDHAADPYILGKGFDRESQSLLVRTGMVGCVGERNEVAYGLFTEVETDMTMLVGPGLTGDFMLFGVYTEEITLMPGEENRFTRYLTVGRDIAEINSSRYGLSEGVDMATITGKVTSGGIPVLGARVFLSSKVSGFLDMAVTDSSGDYIFNSPVGDYNIVVTGDGEGEEVEYPPAFSYYSNLADGYGRGDTAKVSLEPGDVINKDLSLPLRGMVRINVTDLSGIPIPAKVTFEFKGGDDPTPPDPLIWEKNPYPGIKKVFWTVDGSFEGGIEPGEYAVTASYGFEYEIDQGNINVRGDDVAKLNFSLERVVDTAGFVSIDSHRHAGPSNHGEARAEDSIITNITEGLFSFASSDHDIITDYNPLISALGMTEKILCFPSVEISTAGMGDDGRAFSGHFNPFPVILLDDKINNGAPLWWEEGWTPGRIFQYSREVLGAKLVQINHGGDNGYFCWRGYEPATGKAADPEYSDDYDLMEIINGKRKGNWLSELTIWYGHLNHGKKVTGVGVSDSHKRLNSEPGYGRSYVRVPGKVKHPVDFSAEHLESAMKAQQVIVSGGPFISDFRISSADNPSGVGMGETISGNDIRMEFKVHAPLWMGELGFRINENGKTIMTHESREVKCGHSRGALRFDCMADLSIVEDSWYNVETRALVDSRGDNTLWPVYPGAIAIAVTNPIYVDVDGDGFTPPHFPPETRREDGRNCD